ncbi:hypothetical protein A9K55_005550 [Cordyceps militaris]|uniref:Uncharacterized protein n=1 Tax=Cordyceps militaris TaxID=73501 RepID=A0A2H4SCX0_CORMI|nr:hypothetical protein A9K55_005550 [Cordyceps militaris]
MMESPLDAAGLWSLPEVASMEESLAEVYSKLAAVVSHNCMGHRDCRIGVKVQLEDISGIRKDD